MTYRRPLLLVMAFGLICASCGSPHHANSLSSLSTATTEAPVTTSSTTTTHPGVVPAIGTKSFVKSTQAPVLVANITYPELGGMASGQIEANINAAISQAVTGFVSSFEATISGETSATPPGGSVNGVTQSQISGSFTNELVDSRYVSFRFLVTTYSAGAASPSTEAHSLTFNLSNGQLLTLTDLFSGSNYLSTLSSLARSALASKLGKTADPNFIDGGTQPYAANFANWNLTASGLELTFSQGTVAASATGVVTIIVPYSAVSTVANSSGPLTNP